MKKRWVYLSAALMLAAGIYAARPVISGAVPADPVKLDMQCTLNVSPISPNKEEYRADMMTAEITLDLYKVADAEEVKGYDTYQLKPLDAYSAALKFSDYSDLQELTAADWETYAQEAAKIALDKDAPQVPQVSRNVGWEGETSLSGADMKAGLYLLVARDTGSAVPAEYARTVKMKKPEGETGEADEKFVTIASSLRYEYRFEPQLISLPAKEAVNDEINTANPGDWLYAQSVYLKPERGNRYASLKIIKTLRDYESVEGTIEPVTFVFRAVGTLEDENGRVYDEVTSLTFTEAGSGEAVLERVPAADTITVTEIYSGISYEQTVPAGNGTVVLENISAEPDAVNEARFENVYNNRRTHGHGIKNEFRYSDSVGGWQWTPDPAQQPAGQGGE